MPRAESAHGAGYCAGDRSAEDGGYFRRVYAGEDLPELPFGEDPFGETGPTEAALWLVKTLNEYARHNGHADILRELIDGTVGE